jgi:hypothetical protein
MLLLLLLLMWRPVLSHLKCIFTTTGLADDQVLHE